MHIYLLEKLLTYGAVDPLKVLDIIGVAVFLTPVVNMVLESH